MDKAKRARTAETPKQPSLGLQLRAPYLYPDRGLGHPSPIRAGGRATWQAVAVCGADQYVAQAPGTFLWTA